MRETFEIKFARRLEFILEEIQILILKNQKPLHIRQHQLPK